MVSDTDIVRRLTSVLRKADLSTTTTAAIRKQLEKDLGVDLTDRKAFIREQVDLILEEQQAEEQELTQDSANAEEDAEEPEYDEGQEQEDEQDGEEGEEEQKPRRNSRGGSEPDSKRFKAKIERAMKASLPKEKKKRVGGSGGLNKVCSLSPELQAIIGETELPRTQVVKQLWVYIRENGLQDPDNKKKILCDDAFRGLFGVESTDIFKMNKLLSKHIWPLDKPLEELDAPKAKKPKTEKVEGEKPKSEKKEMVKPKVEKKDSERSKVEKKDGGRGRPSGLLPLSDDLVAFLGTDKSEMEQHEVVKAVWDYIGEHKLQDPADKKTIICDEKLQDLFGCDTFVGFGLTRLLAPHLCRY